MNTVFSHIVSTQLSKKSENVATAALSFILGSSDEARNGILKLLRGVVPKLPSLRFRIQETDGSSRPDMWGYDDGSKPHVLIENKFWAGLTDNQPISYLEKLAKCPHPTTLLFVVPERRKTTVWHELNQRLHEKGIPTTHREPSLGIDFNVTTGLGPILALTSWAKLLSFLEVETTNDPEAKDNLLQLRSLCDQEDIDAFIPFSPEDISDQQIPSLVIRMTSVVNAATDLAFTEKILVKGKKLKLSSNSLRIGLYASILSNDQCGLWFGVHFALWKKYGYTPFWGLFSTSHWGRAPEVRALLEPWAAENKVFVATEPNGYFVVSFKVQCAEQKDVVVRKIVDRFKEISLKLTELKPIGTEGLKAIELAEPSDELSG